jgi:signal peptidase I
MSNLVQKVGESFLDFIETIAVSLAIFLVIYQFFLQPHQVDGLSMVPNFQDKEYLLTDKITYKLRDPQRGEVIVFHAPPAANCVEGTGCDFIKRIIGLPGDQIEVKENAIWVNGQKLIEDYIPENFVTEAHEATQNKVITLASNEYFVCGDNRPYSSDSRRWGPITRAEIVGRVFFRYWPVSAIGTIRHANYPNNTLD